MQRHEYIGNLTRDPETLETKGGKPFVKFTLAVNGQFGKTKRVDYIAVSSFAKPVIGFVSKYLRKGSTVWVEGNNLTVDAWKKRDGSTEVTVSLIASDVQSFGRAGVVGGGDGDAMASDASEPVGGGNGSWNPAEFESAQDEELPWG